MWAELSKGPVWFGSLFLYETNGTGSGGDADMPLLADVAPPAQDKRRLRQRHRVQAVTARVSEELVSLGSVLLTAGTQLSALELIHI